MKRFTAKLSLVIIALCAVFAFTACDGETPAPMPVVGYTLTLVTDGTEAKVPASSDGAYKIDMPPEKIGYTSLGYFLADGTPFSLEGVISCDVTVYAKYEILPTKSFQELKTRMEAGADILLAGDIELSETIFVSEEVCITSDGAYTLKRAPSFLGDLFIIGTYSDGKNPLLDGKEPALVIKPAANASVTVDGNKANVTGDVNGTAFLIKNSATLEIYDGAEIINCKKTANAYFLDDGHNMSDPTLIGGPAVIVANGAFNMYGGAIRNCEADMDDSASTPKAEQTEGYNYSSRGGAVFNYGTFNMHGGVIENCKAGRGGAIYNYRIMYLYAGEIKNNHTSSYGGAFYNPNSQYVYAVIGQDTKEIKMTVSGNTSAKTGGAGYVAHQSVVYVIGATLFKENKALDGNGGALNAAGSVIIDYAVFERNTATSKGGAIYAYYSSAENSIREVIIKSGTFSENEAPRGGAIGLNRGDDVTVGTRVKLWDVEFKNNKAPLASGDKYGYGGAIHIDQASTLEILGSTSFINNVSATNGGAIYATKTSTLAINAGAGVTASFIKNTSSDGNGGAIYNSNSEVVLFAHAGGVILFDGNEAVTGNGGAIATHSQGTTKLYGVVAKDNKATEGSGGALYVYGAYAVIADATMPIPSSFIGNSAEKGGAIYVSAAKADAKIDVYELWAEANTASGGGGAIYLVASEDYDATLSAVQINLLNNESGGNGGGMYIYTNAKADIESLAAVGNKTASGKYGGAAYISGKANVFIKNIEAKANVAASGGAIYLTASGTNLTISKGSVTENLALSSDAGNAIWVNSKSSQLKLETNLNDEILLAHTAGEILGVSGFEITKYKVVME